MFYNWYVWVITKQEPHTVLFPKSLFIYNYFFSHLLKFHLFVGETGLYITCHFLSSRFGQLPPCPTCSLLAFLFPAFPANQFQAWLDWDKTSLARINSRWCFVCLVPHQETYDVPFVLMLRLISWLGCWVTILHWALHSFMFCKKRFCLHSFQGCLYREAVLEERDSVSTGARGQTSLLDSIKHQNSLVSRYLSTLFVRTGTQGTRGK